MKCIATSLHVEELDQLSKLHLQLIKFYSVCVCVSVGGGMCVCCKLTSVCAVGDDVAIYSSDGRLP